MTVLFGGIGYSGGNYLNDTWEWDGTTWTQRSPATSPLARYYHAMAYDSVRGVTVLFGGVNGSYPYYPSDTWEWDGANWTQRNPATSPSVRYRHAMAYDNARGRTVLFGGWINFSLGDTWEWDGTNWTQRSTIASPWARYAHAMAYDNNRNTTVLFAGVDSSNYILSDTWEWNRTTWTRRFPATSPPLRYSHAMVYDSNRHVTVLFGGGGSTYLADTWEWDGTNWSQRTPAARPPGRYGHALAYDRARGVTVLFGGYNGSTRLSDTWEWDGTTWTQRSPATNPPARSEHAMAYDSIRGVTVLFGGQTYPSPYVLGDTWEWNGTTWTQASPASSPSARDRHAMVYDSASGVTVLFGGYGGGYLSDTWEWNGMTWTQLSPATSPPARYYYAMAYDSARGRTALFGGFHGGSPLGDTWEFDSTGAPTILQQPSNQVACPGDTVTLSVTASGIGTMSYHWRRNGVNLTDGPRVSGAATPTLTLRGVVNAGPYDVVVTDQCNSTVSQAVWIQLCTVSIAAE